MGTLRRTTRILLYGEQGDVLRPTEGSECCCMSVCSAQTYKLIRNLLAPQTLDAVNYDDIVKRVFDYVRSKPSVILQRFRFTSRNRKEGKSVADFCDVIASIIDKLSLWEHSFRHGKLIKRQTGVRNKRREDTAETPARSQLDIEDALRIVV